MNPLHCLTPLIHNYFFLFSLSEIFYYLCNRKIAYQKINALTFLFTISVQSIIIIILLFVIISQIYNPSANINSFVLRFEHLIDYHNQLLYLLYILRHRFNPITFYFILFNLIYYKFELAINLLKLLFYYQQYLTITINKFI